MCHRRLYSRKPNNFFRLTKSHVGRTRLRRHPSSYRGGESVSRTLATRGGQVEWRNERREDARGCVVAIRESLTHPWPTGIFPLSERCVPQPNKTTTSKAGKLRLSLRRNLSPVGHSRTSTPSPSPIYPGVVEPTLVSSLRCLKGFLGSLMTFLVWRRVSHWLGRALVRKRKARVSRAETVRLFFLRTSSSGSGSP